jgi:hypothetical protein
MEWVRPRDLVSYQGQVWEVMRTGRRIDPEGSTQTPVADLKNLLDGTQLSVEAPEGLHILTEMEVLALAAALPNAHTQADHGSRTPLPSSAALRRLEALRGSLRGSSSSPPTP